MRARARRRSVAVGLLTLACSLALTGCLRMPEQGPIVTIDPPSGSDTQPGTYYDPRPPTAGASPQEIVTGFLEAMKATPINSSVAAQYLSTQAQEVWKPERATLTYSEVNNPVGGREIRVRLVDAQHYDSRGAWTHPLDSTESTLEFPMVIEGNEWRIDAAPDALVVPGSWFDDRFERASLHFLDPTSGILVPEPVYVPQGDQFATALVQGLLAGPPAGLEKVVRTALPPGLTLALSSVPIDKAGVADIALEGPLGNQAEEVLSEEMVAQLAWTLRQEPRIRAMRLTLNGRPATLTEGSQAEEIGVDAGARFDPDDLRATSDLFALRDGLLVTGQLDDLEPTTGSFGTRRFGLRSAGINLAGTTAAGVSNRGTSVLVAAVAGPETEAETLATEVVSGATDMLPPAWDFADRLWLVDRTSFGAQVLVVVEDQPRGLMVPGLTGKEVVSFLVSRDGSRLVAAVRGRNRDSLLVSRVQHDADGRVLRVTRAQEIDLDLEAGGRIIDIGWRSPTSVGVLTGINDDLSQVRTVAVEGAPGDLDTGGASRIRGQATRLVSSPVEGESVFVLGRRTVTDLMNPGLQLPDLDDRITWLGYAG